MVDPFWSFGDVQLIGSLCEAPVAISKSSSKKPASTKADRATKLKSTFSPICDIAAQTVGATDRVVVELGKLLQGLNVTLPAVARKSSDAASASLELVGNPKVQGKQNQKRTQPSSSGAPTTKSNKQASRKSKRDRQESQKAKDARAAGRDSAGKKTWG